MKQKAPKPVPRSATAIARPRASGYQSAARVMFVWLPSAAPLEEPPRAQAIERPADKRAGEPAHQEQRRLHGRHLAARAAELVDQRQVEDGERHHDAVLDRERDGGDGQGAPGGAQVTRFLKYAEDASETITTASTTTRMRPTRLNSSPRIDSFSAKPMPPAPTSPSTVDSRMLMSHR